MSAHSAAPPVATEHELAEELMKACESGNTMSVERCLARGADPKGINATKRDSPLYGALSRNHIDVAALLVAAGARVTNDLAMSVLWQGIYPEAVAFCLTHGIDANAVLVDDTVAYHAVKSGNTDIARVVYESGGRLEATGRDGRPVSHALVWPNGWHGNSEEERYADRVETTMRMAAWLISHNVNLRAVDNLGRTALSEAIKFWRLSAILALLRYGGVASPQEAFSIIANILAKANSESPQIDIIIQRVVSDLAFAPVLRCRDYKRRSLLHWAAKRSTVKTLAHLLKAGLSASERDAGGKKPEAYARGNSQEAIGALRAAEAKEQLANPRPARLAPAVQ